MDDINKRLKKCLNTAYANQRKGTVRINANKTLYDSGYYVPNSDLGRKSVVDAFFTTLDYREKRKYGPIDYQRFYFYIAKNGRLAAVAKNKAQTLIRRGKIKNRIATEEIPSGTYVKHRRIIESLETNNRKMNRIAKEILENYFDEQEPCKMIIDTNFEIAYEPDYHGNLCTDGDLATETSCMSRRGSEAQEFYGGIKGCKIARFETSDGKQVGRCIVYEHEGKRHFIRVYGIGKYHRTMLNLIKDNMKENDLFGRSKAFDNLCLETDWTADTPNMYLDGDEYGVKIGSDGKYYVVSYTYDYEGDSTDRCSLSEAMDEGYYTCEHCGNRVHEDDVLWAGDYTYCCESCANADGWYRCEWCSEWQHEDDCIYVEEDDRYYCCEHCVEKDGYVRCSECGNYVSESRILTSEDDAICICRSCLEKSDKYTMSEDGYVIEQIKDGEENE